MGAGAAAVDEGRDGGGVVVVVDGQDRVGERVAVVGDEVVEVVGDLLGLGGRHAGVVTLDEGLVGREGKGRSGKRHGREDGGEGTHLGYYWCDVVDCWGEEIVATVGIKKAIGLGRMGYRERVTVDTVRKREGRDEERSRPKRGWN